MARKNNREEIKVVKTTLDLKMKKLIPVLEKLNRGDVLYDHVILELTGETPQRLRNRIYKWFSKERGISIQHRCDPINGFKLLKNKEQSKLAHSRVGQGTKKYIRGGFEASCVDSSKLTQKEMDVHDKVTMLLERIVQTAIGWQAESRFILKEGGNSKKIKELEKKDKKASLELAMRGT